MKRFNEMGDEAAAIANMEGFRKTDTVVISAQQWFATVKMLDNLTAAVESQQKEIQELKSKK